VQSLSTSSSKRYAEEQYSPKRVTSSSFIRVMILSQIWYITELVGYTYLLWSKICTLPHVFLLRFARWRRRSRLWTQQSTGVPWRTWWIATPLWWNMRWLRPHDFKQENAHENILTLRQYCFNCRDYTELRYMGTRSCNGK